MMNSPLSNRQPNWPNRRFDMSSWQHKSIKIFPPTPDHTAEAEADPNPSDSVLNKKQSSNEPLHGLKAISFCDLIAPLAEALKQNQQWVEDFGQEKIILPADLHEIVLMFGELQQGDSNISKRDQDPPPENEPS